MSAKKVNIDQLIDSYLELGASNSDILKEMMKDEGYDPQELEIRGMQKVKYLLFQNEAYMRKQCISNLYDKAITFLKESTEHSRFAIFALLQKKAPTFQFNHLERLDEENLRQILDETEILDLIDKLEKGEL